MSDDLRDPELSALAGQLAALTPAPSPALDRDRLLFLAGRASAPRAGWRWPLCSAGLALLAVALGWRSTVREPPAAVVVERIVFVPTPAPPPPTPNPPPTPPVPTPAPPVVGVPDSPADEPRTDLASAWKLRQQVFSQGVDALPRPEPPAALPRLPDDGLDLAAERPRLPWFSSYLPRRNPS